MHLVLQGWEAERRVLLWAEGGRKHRLSEGNVRLLGWGQGFGRSSWEALLLWWLKIDFGLVGLFCGKLPGWRRAGEGRDESLWPPLPKALFHFELVLYSQQISSFSFGVKRVSLVYFQLQHTASKPQATFMMPHCSDALHCILGGEVGTA